MATATRSVPMSFDRDAVARDVTAGRDDPEVLVFLQLLFADRT